MMITMLGIVSHNTFGLNDYLLILLNYFVEDDVCLSTLLYIKFNIRYGDVFIASALITTHPHLYIFIGG